MKFRTLCLAALTLAATINRVHAAEEPKPPQGAPLQREAYSDAVAGYSLLLPAGYRKLSDDEMHFVSKRLSEYLGKDAGERTIKRPPAYFLGPTDASKKNPPSMAISFSDSDQQFNPAELPALKAQLEEQHKREGEKVAEFEVKITKVDGLDSLQVENDSFDQFGNERSRKIRIAVPAKGKWIEIIFNFSPEQTEAVHASVKEALDSFKVMEHPPANVANQDKWLRITYITLGSGVVGLLLGFLLQKRKKSA